MDQDLSAPAVAALLGWRLFCGDDALSSPSLWSEVSGDGAFEFFALVPLACIQDRTPLINPNEYPVAKSVFGDVDRPISNCAR